MSHSAEKYWSGAAKINVNKLAKVEQFRYDLGFGVCLNWPAVFWRLGNRGQDPFNQIRKKEQFSSSQNLLIN
jgi:hypothetical protein